MHNTGVSMNEQEEETIINHFNDIRERHSKNLFIYKNNNIKDIVSEKLVKILKNHRKYIRLRGHCKINGQQKCICGNIMEHSKYKSSNWLCPKEEKEWDFIIYKLNNKGEKNV